MPNDDEVLYDPGTTPQAKASDDKSEVIYDPAAASTAPRSDPQQITAPKASDFVPDSQTIPNLAKGAGEGAINMGKGIVNTIAHPIDALTGLGHTVADTYRSTRGDIKGGTPGQIPLDIATGAARIAGFDEPHLAQEWNQGQGARAVGESAPTAVLDALAAEKIAGRGDLEVNGKPVTQSVRETAQKGVYDAEGKMRPLAKTAARVAGAAAGGVTPIPGGAVVGAIAGPEALRGIIPAPEIPEPELGTPENPGWMTKLPDRIPAPVDPVVQAVREGRASRLPTRLAAPEPELGTPENPGWMVKLPDRIAPQEDPLAVAVREGRAAKLPTTIPAPVDPVVQAVREGRASRLPTRLAAPEPELGTPENPGWMTKLPDRMPTPVPELGSTENPGWVTKLPDRMSVAKPSASRSIMAGPDEGPIGSGPTERQVQTLMQKPILTPDEQAFVERVLGPNARMKSGEGLTKWRSRVTGGFKAARPRTE